MIWPRLRVAAVADEMMTCRWASSRRSGAGRSSHAHTYKHNPQGNHKRQEGRVHTEA